MVETHILDKVAGHREEELRELAHEHRGRETEDIELGDILADKHVVDNHLLPEDSFAGFVGMTPVEVALLKQTAQGFQVEMMDWSKEAE